jgi:hypothetical protein
MSRKMLMLAAAAVMATAAVAYAQRYGGQNRGGRRGGEGGYQEAPRRPDARSFTGDFTFCRLAYRQAYDGYGGGWGVDYPRADQNLPIRLSELSRAPVNFDSSGDPNYYVVIPSDPELFNCPFLMMSEFGATHFEPDEAKAIRDYLLKGGFLWADDSWGSRAWDHWVGEVRKIFPETGEYPIIDVPINHAMFHSIFDVKRIPQIPAIGRWGGPGDSTSEQGADSAVVYTRAIADAKGRIMLFITHNTDFGDSYEREGDDPRYFYAFSVDGYAVGIDTLVYAMTH